MFFLTKASESEKNNIIVVHNNLLMVVRVFTTGIVFTLWLREIV